MKFVFSALSMIVIALASLAHAMEPVPSEPVVTLKSTMSEMNAALKAIVSQIGDVSLNPKSKELADTFVGQVEVAKTFVPETISSLPEVDQPAQLEIYLKMLDDTAVLGRKLSENFEKNDNEEARRTLKALGAAKNDGHGEFK